MLSCATTELVINVTLAQTNSASIVTPNCMMKYKFKYQLDPKNQLNTNEQVQKQNIY